MSTFADAWRKAGDPVDDYDPPNGAYAVVIVDAGAFAGRDNREWAKCVLEVKSGVDQGRRFDHFMNLNNEVGMRIARESLLMYGMHVGELDDPDADLDTLSRAMAELVGTVADVSVTHKDGFRNIKVDGSVTARPGAGVGPHPTSAPTKAPEQQSFDTAITAATSTGPAPDDDEPIPF